MHCQNKSVYCNARVVFYGCSCGFVSQVRAVSCACFFLMSAREYDQGKYNLLRHMYPPFSQGLLFPWYDRREPQKRTENDNVRSSCVESCPSH